MSRSNQPKTEKALIDLKVSKVREVVRNVSTNDIVLALHNFDLDVNRTIHAFTEGNVDSALGDWERNGAKKGKQKKKKGNSADTASVTTSTATETPQPKSISAKPATTRPVPPTTSQIPKAPVVEIPAISASAFSKLDESEKLSELERLASDLEIKSVQIKQRFDSALAEESAVISAIIEAAKSRGHQITTFLNEQRRVAEAELTKHNGEVRQLKSTLKNGGSADVSQILRGSNLGSILSAQYSFDGSKALQAIEKIGAPLISSTPTSKPIAAKPQSNGVTEHRPQEKKPQQNGKQNGGTPTKVLNPAKVDMTHSTSQSSLVSSVGEDSGLGQISPVMQDTKPAVSKGANGGIIMQSDGLSADQLAALQRQLAESLKAQGIDQSVLSGIMGESATFVTPRRRGPPQQRKDGGAAKPKKNGDGKAAVKVSH